MRTTPVSRYVGKLCAVLNGERVPPKKTLENLARSGPVTALQQLDNLVEFLLFNG